MHLIGMRRSTRALGDESRMSLSLISMLGHVELVAHAHAEVLVVCMRPGGVNDITGCTLMQGSVEELVRVAITLGHAHGSIVSRLNTRDCVALPDRGSAYPVNALGHVVLPPGIIRP